MKTSTIARTIGKFLSKNSSKLLTGAAIAGVVSTVYFAIKATPKACELIEEKKQELDVEKLPMGETVKTVSKVYVPTLISGVATIGCMIGATAIGSRQAATLMAAANISDIAYKEYRNAVKEKNPELHEEIMDGMTGNKLLKTPCRKEDIIRTIHGDELCFDELSGRYFTADKEFIRESVNNFNAQLLHDMSLSLNDFYDLLDLPHIGIGDTLGWNIHGGTIDVHYSSMLTEGGKPVLVMTHYDTPHAGFSNEW